MDGWEWSTKESHYAEVFVQEGEWLNLRLEEKAGAHFTRPYKFLDCFKLGNNLHFKKIIQIATWRTDKGVSQETSSCPRNESFRIGGRNERKESGQRIYFEGSVDKIC